MKHEYLTNASFSEERNGNYKKASKATAPFEHTTEEIGDFCGNVYHQLIFNPETKKAKWDDKSRSIDSIKTYLAAPSCLVMYRLACLFSGSIETYGQDGYKSVWSMTLKHKSGALITFSEHKGGWGFWLPEYSHTELDKEFKADIKRLVELLVSDDCPHPYDGVVAGSVA